MRYEHTPRPLVEDHYHIRHLIETQDKRANERTYFREKEKTASEREDTIRDAKWFETLAFWCSDCKEDFGAQAIKQIETDWTNTNQRIAYYTSKHFCGKWCMRLITDKHKDPYWMQSKAVAVDRAKGHNDTIQPWEEGFQLLYGRKNSQQ